MQRWTPLLLVLAACPKPAPTPVPVDPAPADTDAADPLAELGDAEVVLPDAPGASSVASERFAAPDPFADGYDRDALAAHCASTGSLAGGPGAGWAHVAISPKAMWVSGHPVVALSDGMVPDSAFDPDAVGIISPLYNRLREISEEAEALRAAGCAVPDRGARDRQMVLSVDGRVPTSTVSHALSTAGSLFYGRYLMRVAGPGDATVAPDPLDKPAEETPLPVQVVIGAEGVDVRTGPVSGTPVPLKCDAPPCLSVADLDHDGLWAALQPLKEKFPAAGAVVVVGSDAPAAALAHTLGHTALGPDGIPLFTNLLLAGGDGPAVDWTVPIGDPVDPEIEPGDVIPGTAFRLPSFAAPPRKTAGPGVLIMGGMAKESVMATIGTAMPTIVSCFEDNALKADEAAAGRVVLQFTVGVTGAVFDAVVATSQLAHEPTETCIVDAVKGLTFPKPSGDQAKVTYPFQFGSSASPGE